MTDTDTRPIPVMLWHPDGQRVALHGQDFPVLELKKNADIGKAIQEACNIPVWLLDDAGISFGMTGTPRLRALSDALPAELTWGAKAVPALPSQQVWQRPDWPERMQARLAQAELPVLEAKLVHSNDLVNIVQVTTSSSTAYLKTSSTPQEARLTAYVAAHFPELAPPLLACNPAEQWQVTASGGPLLDAVDDLTAWEQAITRLIEFQRSADAAALAKLGAPAHRFSDVSEQVFSLLNDTPALKSWGLGDDKIQLLQDALPQIKRAFQDLAALNLPDLPAHGDAHPRNALHGERGSVWFDWSEVSCAAHPLMDLGWFLAFTLHPAGENLPIRQAFPELETKLSHHILQALDLPQSKARLLGAAIPLAYLHRAAIYDQKFLDWQGNIPGWRPNYVPYYFRQAVRELGRLKA